MKIFSVLFFTLLSCLPSSAIIGETREQCDTRYGAPKSKGDTYASYLKDGVEITVSFSDKKAVKIFYSRKDAQDNTVHFKEVEVLAILKTNGGSKVWKEVDDIPNGTGWRTEDKTLFAEESYGGQLEVTNRDRASPFLRE